MRKILCIAATIILMSFFLLCPEAALAASRKGLALWFNRLLPVLLPFSILSYVILRSRLFSSLRGSRHLSAEESYILLCGFLFGFPIGSKLTADVFREGKIPRERAQMLLIFTNNLSPAFVTAALREQLGLTRLYVPLALIYGLPFVSLLFELHRLPYACAGKKNTTSGFRLDMQIIDAGIINGFETLIKICGYVVLFSLGAELLHQLPLPELLQTVLIGCTEVTTGISELSGLTNESLRLVAGVGILSWGGVSGYFQTASIVSGTGLSMKRYLLCRLLLAMLAALGAALSVVFPGAH